MIEVNLGQVRQVVEDCKDLDDSEPVELVQLAEWEGTVEYRLPDSEQGSFVRPDRTTEY